MVERSTGLERRLKRLAFVLLVVLALHTTPALVEQIGPEARVFQVSPAHAEGDYAKDDKDEKDQDNGKDKKDKDKSGGGVVLPAGDGGSY